MKKKDKSLDITLKLIGIMFGALCIGFLYNLYDHDYLHALIDLVLAIMGVILYKIGQKLDQL